MALSCLLGLPLLDSRTSMFTWRVARILFWLATAVTLVSLLATAESVLAAKVWVASWLPFSAELDVVNFTSSSDKLVHAGLFALLGWLGARGWVQHRQRWGLVAGLLVLGVFTEVLQSLIPGRSASLSDWFADAFGVCAGLLSGPPASDPKVMVATVRSRSLAGSAGARTVRK